ncbi:AraC family transcriptional regulator [Puteibacter caeruleilacunae]|nr:AraC family transcriptional regulator [Puteibacter caeruleilacunae]
MILHQKSFHLHIINIEQCALDSSWNYKDVCSPFFRMFYIVSGEGTLSFNDKEIILRPHNLYLIPNFTNCNYSCEDSLEMIYIIFIDELSSNVAINHFYNIKNECPASDFDQALFKRLLVLNPEQGLKNYDPKSYDNWTYLERQLKFSKIDTFRDYTESRGILLQLFSRFITPETKHPGQKNKSIEKVILSLQYISQNLDKKITLELLADQAFLSKDYFSRIFMKITQCRPIEYIQRKRIEKAQLLLATTNLSIEQIAEQTGLNNASYLTRLFKRYTEKSPGQYRQEGSLNKWEI